MLTEILTKMHMKKTAGFHKSAKKAEVSSQLYPDLLNLRELVKESTILRVESAMRELE